MTFNGTSYTNPLGIYNGSVSFPLGGIITIDSYEWASDTSNWSGSIDWFLNNAYNSGILKGRVVFGSGVTYNLGTVIGEAYFYGNGTSYNAGTVMGDAFFNYAGIQDGGTVTGNATFEYTLYNSTQIGTVNGDVIFPNGATITVDGTTWDRNTSSWTGTLNWIFQNAAVNAGTVSNATFNDASSNAVNGTVTGDAVFNDDSINYGNLSGSSLFNDNSTNAAVQNSSDS